MGVDFDVTNGLATITLARSDANNALDRELKAGFLDGLRRSAAEAVRAVLITAEGKNFCVGQDLSEHVQNLRADPSAAMETVAEHYNPLIRALSAIEVPVVVAVRGACVGAGFGIALAGDVRIASERTTFATAFTGIGLAADSGLSHSLVRMLGPSRATGLLLFGDKVGATQALDWGLVHRVVADDQLETTAAEIASRFAAGPSQAYREVKRLVAASAAGLDDALERELTAARRLGQSRDHRAAVDAFLAKQQPTFLGE